MPVSVARGETVQKVWMPQKLAGKWTTTNRRGAKRFATFCVFLLTDLAHRLILPFQIRGMWKHQRDRVESHGRFLGPRKATRFLAKKSSAKGCLRAPSAADLSAVRPSAVCRPAAEHGLSRKPSCDCSAVVFFRSRLPGSPASPWVCFRPSP